jgi:hypothetical protein
MPQFDTAAFFSQLLWLTVTFYAFYLVLFHHFLPGLSRILKVRRKKLDLASSQGSAFESEGKGTLASFESLLSRFGNGSRALITKSIEASLLWQAFSLTSLQGSSFQSPDRCYLGLQGDLRGQQLAAPLSPR